MSKVKLYESPTWLRREYLIKKKKPGEIAREQGVSERTIYNYLKEFKLLR